MNVFEQQSKFLINKRKRKKQKQIKDLCAYVKQLFSMYISLLCSIGCGIEKWKMTFAYLL